MYKRTFLDQLMGILDVVKSYGYGHGSLCFEFLVRDAFWNEVSGLSQRLGEKCDSGL
jgi:hypothetical protein